MNKIIIFTLLIFISFISLNAQQRIITAGSSSSEIVCALGDCEKIIATDRTSLYPEKLQMLPSIGYRSNISAEGIISQNPDLVIFEKEYVKAEVISHLQATGIETLVVTQERTIEGIQKRVEIIAKALNKSKEGKIIISEIKQAFKLLEQKIELTTSRPSVLCVYARGQGNMQVGGKNSAFNLVELAGAVNAVPEIEGYKPLNTESLIKANPDFILFFESGLKSLGGKEKILEIPGVSETTAGKKVQIISMNGVFLSNWGPRVAEAAEELFYLTHPEVVK
ncbi:MAG: ABC transporter substrate-binding protein [Flammeovirgaceae bacterium]|nr:ABC transporter substrate-binding protein [Flammeovirgaceae bacterium]